MDETFIQSSAQDGINLSIWLNSRSLQRSISAQSSIVNVGAQQSMPLPCHQKLFSADDPLPWVPDLVGPAFGKAKTSILVVGSSYNGFLRGYTDRRGTMSVDDYVCARNAANPQTGIEMFSAQFIRDVCVGDEAYYARIRVLLKCASVQLESVAITDLCKASFVQRTIRNGWIVDSGNDALIETHMRDWQRYVEGSSGSEEGPVPLPYEWILKRVLKAHVIIALGKLAEYGVIKMLRRALPQLQVSHSQNDRLQPNADSLLPGRGWVYKSALTATSVRSWIESNSWWHIADPNSGQMRALIPCVHPSAWKNLEAYYAAKYGGLLVRVIAGIPRS